MGLSYYGIRLGEILIAASAAILIIYTVFIPIIKKKYFLDNKRLNLILVLLIASFYLLVIFNEENLLNPSIYKTSSYIWSFGALIFGYNFLEKLILKFIIRIYILHYLVFLLFIYFQQGVLVKIYKMNFSIMSINLSIQKAPIYF